MDLLLQARSRHPPHRSALPPKNSASWARMLDEMSEDVLCRRCSCLLRSDLTTKYCFSVYFALTTMTTTGFGDVSGRVRPPPLSAARPRAPRLTASNSLSPLSLLLRSTATDQRGARVRERLDGHRLPLRRRHLRQRRPHPRVLRRPGPPPQAAPLRPVRVRPFPPPPAAPPRPPRREHRAALGRHRRRRPRGRPRRAAGAPGVASRGGAHAPPGGRRGALPALPRRGVQRGVPQGGGVRARPAGAARGFSCSEAARELARRR